MLTSKGHAGGKKGYSAKPAEPYRHPEAESPMRPDVGTQAQFKKKKPPVTYRYDSSLSPALDWDGQNSARELGEQQLSVISSQLSVLREKLVAQRLSSSPPRRAAVPPIEEPQGQKADPALQALAKAEEATAKLKARHHFPSSVVRNEKVFVMGDEHELARLGPIRLADRAQK